MSDRPMLERQLPALLEDLYLGPTPDYRNQVLAAVTHARQRPAWTFPERWIPMTDIASRPAFVPRPPMRTLAIVLLVVALLVAGLVAFVGSRPAPLAPLFGPAKNGLVVYARGGDIFTADPASGSSRAILSGPGVDRKPVVSPDGTRIAFLRGADGSQADSFDLIVAKVDGSDVRTISTAKVRDGDPFTWSPDGTFILMTNAQGDLIRYEMNGDPPKVLVHGAQVQPEAFEPPDARQVLVENLGLVRSLSLMNPDGTGVRAIYTIPASETQDGCDYGTIRWSPAGTQIAFPRRPAGSANQCRVFVMNADGTGAHQLTTNAGQWFETDLRWSPDGQRLAFDRWEMDSAGTFVIRPIGVVSAAGGPAQSLGPTPVSDGAAFEWSPDGRSLISVPGTVLAWPPSTSMLEARPTLIDATSGEAHEAAWSVNSWPTWQRLAP